MAKANAETPGAYSTLAWKRFDKGWWMAFAGATAFGPGADPLVAEGSGWFAVWDCDGVEFHQSEDDGPDDGEWQPEFCQFEGAAIELGRVNPAWTWAQLKAEFDLVPY